MANTTKSLGNIFADIGFPSSEAQNLKIRAELMMEIEQYIIQHSLTQRQAADVFKVDQPRINKLLNGRIDLFTIDKLVLMLSNVKIIVELKVAA